MSRAARRLEGAWRGTTPGWLITRWVRRDLVRFGFYSVCALLPFGAILLGSWWGGGAR